MDSREFITRASNLNLSRVEQAIALLWFHRYTQSFDERTASELANDLQDAGLGKPNVTTLKEALSRSRTTVRGRRVGTFQVNARYLDELNRTYEPIIGARRIEITSSVLNADSVKGTRRYIEKLVDEINGSYDYGFFDATAVLLRRLVESLLIESFIAVNDVAHIKDAGGNFLGLEALINRASGYGGFNLSRSAPDSMRLIKEIGDTAAHDRTYITQKSDIDDIKIRSRRVFEELIVLAKIIT